MDDEAGQGAVAALGAVHEERADRPLVARQVDLQRGRLGTVGLAGLCRVPVRRQRRLQRRHVAPGDEVEQGHLAQRLGLAADETAEGDVALLDLSLGIRSEEHKSELQSLMRTSYDVFCLKQKTKTDYKYVFTQH